MTSMSKNVYFDKLHNIVNKYNNVYHRTIKVRPKSNIYIKFHVENNDKNPKLNVGDCVRISKYKNIFEKYYKLSWSEVAFVI